MNPLQILDVANDHYRGKNCSRKTEMRITFSIFESMYLNHMY